MASGQMRRKNKSSDASVKSKMDDLQKDYKKAMDKFNNTDSRYIKDVQELRIKNLLKQIQNLKDKNPSELKSIKVPTAMPKKPTESKSILGGGTPPGERALENIRKAVAGDSKPKSPSGQMKRGQKKADEKLKPLGPTKNIKDVRGTKSVPKSAPKTVDTKSRRKTSVESMTNEEIKRGMGSKRKAAEKSGDTTPQRKKPGRFSEENVKRVMKEKFGIDVTYDKGDELDPLVARGEEPGRKKGGMVQFTKRGGMYNKPARKNSKG